MDSGQMKDDDEDNETTAVALLGALTRCKMNTIYGRGGASLVFSEAIGQMLLHTMFAHVGGDRAARKALLTVRWGDDETAPFDAQQARAVCPGSMLRAQYPANERAIYDVDGIEHLTARLLCSRVTSSRCSLAATDFTCSPADAVSVDAIRECYVPRALASAAHDTLWAMRWDVRREREIATMYRSTLFCGPTIETVVSSKRSTTLLDDDVTTAAAAVATSDSLKKPKAPNVKWSGSLLLESLSFLDTDNAGGVDAEGSDDGDELATEVVTTAAEIAAAAEEEEADSEHEGGAAVPPPPPPPSLPSLPADESPPPPPPSSSLARGGGKKKSAGSAAAVHYGKGIYTDVNGYALVASTGASPHRTAVAPPPPPPDAHCTRFVRWVKMQGGTRTVLEKTANAWRDMLCARQVCPVRAEAFPCGCVAELIARVYSDFRVEIARDTLRALETSQPPPNAAAVLSVAVKIATGTLPRFIAADPRMREFARRHAALFLGGGGAAAMIHHSAVLSNPGHEDERDCVLHRWGAEVGAARQRFLEQQQRASGSQQQQQWYFCRTRRVPLMATIDHLCANDMHARAGDLFSAAAAIMLDEDNDDAAEETESEEETVAVLDGAWFCDVCWTCSLARAALRTAELPGAPIPPTLGVSESVLVCRGSGGGGGGGTDALVAGAMAEIMRDVRGAVYGRPSHRLVYPFAAAALRAPESRQLYIAAVAFTADLCLEAWNGRRQCAHNLPPFAEDWGGGLLAAQPATDLLRPYERSALACLMQFGHVVDVACAAAATEAARKKIIPGLVCISRPFRPWVVRVRFDSTSPGTKWTRQLRGNDLDEQVQLNVGAFTDAATSSPHALVHFLKHVRLALPRTGATPAIPLVPYWPVAHQFVGGAHDLPAESTLTGRPLHTQRWWRQQQQAHADNPLRPLYRAGASPPPLLEFLCQLESGGRCRVPAEMLTADLPLVHAVCCDRVLTAAECAPVADNPMSLPLSRPFLCCACGREDAGVRTDFASCGPLLPKNSPLLDEIMHYRYGLAVMPHAWPTKATLSAYDVSTRGRTSPAFAREYMVLAVNELTTDEADNQTDQSGF